MYVQWLLEFVWRIFIQGPLLIIEFFTKDNVLSNITSNIGFNIENDYGVINSLINVSVIFGIACFLMVIIFLCKLFKVVITSNHLYTKEQLFSVFKEFGKTIFVTLIFILVFQFTFVAIDLIINAFNEVYNKALANKQGNASNSQSAIGAIPNILYEIIANEKPKDGNHFLFPPEKFLEKADSINFMFSIILVNMFAFFLIWMAWSIYQKFLEIFFLYITFPVSLAFGNDHERIKLKISMGLCDTKKKSYFQLCQESGPARILLHPWPAG